MPGRKCAFTDVPPLPRGMMGSFGSAHPLWTGSSLDSSGDAYGLLNVQRLLKADPRHEEVSWWLAWGFGTWGCGICDDRYGCSKSAPRSSSRAGLTLGSHVAQSRESM